MQAERTSDNAATDSTVTQTLKRMLENRKTQVIFALVLLLIAIRLYLPASSGPVPDASLVSGVTSSSTLENSLTAMLHFQNTLEKQLGETLQQISGAGEITVMLSLATSNDASIAQNIQETQRSTEEKDASGGTKVTTEQVLSSQPVMARSATSNEGIIRLKETAPQINGVVIIATGASNPVIRAALSQAVQTILSLPAHRVSIFPGK